MALERCPNGHFYDPAKHTLCPYCGIPDLQIDKTQPRREGADVPPPGMHNAPAPNPVPQRAGGGSEVVTQPLMRQKTGIDPVVGWLVCVSGPDRGRDFRIRSERNTIGRSETQDISITGDPTISREAHALISFDPKNLRFELIAGAGRAIVYCNGEAVHTSRTLERGDRIDIGQTKLMFVPLCDSSFQWTNGDSSESQGA